MQKSPSKASRGSRARIAFALQLAVLGLMLIGLALLPQHFGEHPVTGSNGAVIGWHG